MRSLVPWKRGQVLGLRAHRREAVAPVATAARSAANRWRRASAPARRSCPGTGRARVRLISLVSRRRRWPRPSTARNCPASALTRDLLVADHPLDVFDHVGLRVAGQQAEVHRADGPAGQHVVLVAGPRRWSAPWSCAASRWCWRSFRAGPAAAGRTASRLDSATRPKPLDLRRHGVEHLARPRRRCRPASAPSSSRANACAHHARSPSALTAGGIDEWPGARLGLEPERQIALLGHADQRGRGTAARAARPR